MIWRIAKEPNQASSVHKEAVWLLFLRVRIMFSRGTVAEPRASVFGSKVDAVFVALDKKGSPHCTLAVVRQSKVIYERGYGMTNLHYNLPITPKSNFYIASTLRQSTVFSLALLAKQRKLSLDEAITEYFHVPAAVYGSVSVRQLIYHISGAQDYFTLSGIVGKSGDDRFTQEGLLDLLGRLRQLNFLPGDQFLYSNSGYVVLTVLVEGVSGKSFREFAARSILQPLGMEHTVFRPDVTVIVRNRVTGDSFKNGAYYFHAAAFTHPGSGGLLPTMDDLFLWEWKFYHNKPGKRTSSLLREIQTPGQLTSGKALTYAFGLEISECRGLKMVEHAGALFGYRAPMMRFAAQEFSVICLCNSNAIQISSDLFARQVADVCLASGFEPAPANGASAASAHEAEGTQSTNPSLFPNVTSQPGWELSTKKKMDDLDNILEGRKLYAAFATVNFELQPVTRSRFRATGPLPVWIDFPETDTPSKSISVAVKGGVRPHDKVNTVSPSSQELSTYAGECYRAGCHVQVLYEARI